MADGQDQVMAMVQDPDFMKLSPAEQQAALTAHDPMFGKVGPADIARFVQAHQGPRAPVAPMGIPGSQMQESSAPGIFRGATATLPFIGQLGGAALGAAPSFGTGALLGGALGAAGGEAARQGINAQMFGDETSLGGIGLQGALGAAQEIPAALAIGRGNYLLKTLGQAKSASQVGDVIEAFKSVNPAAGTRTGLQSWLEMENKRVGNQLGQVLGRATGTVDVASTIESGAYAQAAIRDAAFARGASSTSRVTSALKDAIEAAKVRAGINGNIANAEDLWKFKSTIDNKAFKKALTDLDPNIGSVVVKILQENVSRPAGTMLRTLAPDAGPLLEHMTDVYAGISALQNVGKLGGIGKLGGLAIGSALNPKITATITSPAVAATAVAASQIPAVKKGTDWLTRAATTP